MSGIVTEVLSFVLGGDAVGLIKTCEEGEKALKGLTATSKAQLEQASNAANLSLSEVTNIASKLAKTLGTDMASAATLFNDALQNPVKGLDALHAAGLKVTEAQRAEMESYAENGQTLNAHALVIGEITERYDLLNSSVADLDFSGWDSFSGDTSRIDELTEAERLTREIEATNQDIAKDYAYEAKLLDDLNHKWAEQADLKARAELYRNIPTTKNLPTSQMTNSEFAASRAATSGGGMGSAALGLVGGPVGLTAVALSVATAAATKSVMAFSEAEAIGVRLESVLKATGNAAGFTADEMNEMANEIQRTTRFEDEAAKSAMILVAKMKNIQGDNFKQTMTVAADLAEVMGTDLPSAAETLGRALASPEQAAGRLARAGIFLTDKQKEQIAAAMKLNDVAAAQKIILDEVASSTGGAASAAVGTLAGKWDQLKNKVGDVAEAIGGKLAGPTSMILDYWTMLAKGAEKLLNPIDAMTEAWIRSRIEINRLSGDMEKVIELEGQLASLLGGDNATTAPAGEDPKQKENAARERARLAEQRRDYAAAQKDAKLRAEYERKYGLSADDGYADSMERGVANAAKDKQREDRSKERAYQANRAEFMASPENDDVIRRENIDRAQVGLGPRQEDSGKDAREALQSAGRENALAMVNGMKSELNAFAASDDLQFDWKKMVLSDQSQKDLDNILAKYRANVALMPGYNEEAWAKTEAIVQENLRKAAKSTGEQRTLYLQNADNAIKASEKMFDDHFAKLEAAKRKAAEVVDLSPGDVAARYGDDLRNVNRDEAVSVFDEMGGGIKSTLAPDATGAIDDQNVQRILNNYKAMLSQMPGFSAPIFAKIEKQITENARKAMETTGGMREMYLKRLEQTLADGEKVFEKKAKQAEDKPRDEFADMETMSKKEIQGRMGAIAKSFPGAIRAAGATDEQQKGLKALSDEYLVTMRKVRDSTGDARKANIEELKLIQDAWAKAYQAIRDGSKKTVEQLVEDAKKQGKAGTGAAGERALSVKEQRQADIAARDANDALMRNQNPMDAIMNMSQGISNMLSASMSNIGAGAAMLAQVMNQTTDPMQKLALEMGNVSARLEAARLNASTFNGGMQVMIDLQNELNGLQQKQMDIRRKQDADRKAAEDRRSENYKKRQLEKELQATEERRELGYDLASAVQVGAKAGSAPTINIYGSHDAKEIVGKIDQVLKDRGLNRGITRTLDSRGS
jgi:hypothetical protein